MKKLFLVLLTGLLIFSAGCAKNANIITAGEDIKNPANNNSLQTIKVSFEGQIIPFTTEPRYEDGFIIIPLQEFVTNIGASYTTDNEAIIIVSGTTTLTFTKKADTFVVNNLNNDVHETRRLSKQIYEENGVLYATAEDIAKGLGYSAIYNMTQRTLIIE